LSQAAWTSTSAADELDDDDDLCRVDASPLLVADLQLLVLSHQTGNESVPIIIVNDIINLFFKLQSAFCWFQTITVSVCCLTKLIPCILLEKYTYILALEMASPGNQHCANCIGTLLFSIRAKTDGSIDVPFAGKIAKWIS